MPGAMGSRYSSCNYHLPQPHLRCLSQEAGRAHSGSKIRTQPGGAHFTGDRTEAQMCSLCHELDGTEAVDCFPGSVPKGLGHGGGLVSGDLTCPPLGLMVGVVCPLQGGPGDSLRGRLRLNFSSLLGHELLRRKACVCYSLAHPQPVSGKLPGI